MQKYNINFISQAIFLKKPKKSANRAYAQIADYLWLLSLLAFQHFLYGFLHHVGSYHWLEAEDGLAVF